MIDNSLRISWLRKSHRTSTLTDGTITEKQLNSPDRFGRRRNCRYQTLSHCPTIFRGVTERIGVGMFIPRGAQKYDTKSDQASSGQCSRVSETRGSQDRRIFDANLTSTLTNSLQTMLTHIPWSGAGRSFLSSPRRKVFRRFRLRRLVGGVDAG